MARVPLALIVLLAIVGAGCLSGDDPPGAESTGACRPEAASSGSGAHDLNVHVGNERAEEACVRVLVDDVLLLVQPVASSGNLPGQYEEAGPLRVDASQVRVRVEDARSGLEASGTFELREENHLVVHVYRDRIQLDLTHEPPAFQ